MDKHSYKDAVLAPDGAIVAAQAKRVAGRLTELSVMSMNRKARRGIAKANGIARIAGTTRPIAKDTRPR